MTWQIFFTVFTFGGIGAVVRGLIMYILAASATIFPIAIVLVNVLAAFLGAFIINMALPNDLQISMVAGFIGGLGTLSAIPGNILELLFQHGFKRLALYFALTIFLSLGGAYVGGSLGGIAHIQAQKWSGQYDTIQGLKAYKETLEASQADLAHEMHVHEEYAKELREQELQKQNAHPDANVNYQEPKTLLPRLNHDAHNHGPLDSSKEHSHSTNSNATSEQTSITNHQDDAKEDK